MWTKPLAEFLLVEPACSPLSAVAQHATDHLSGIDATHRTHVQETVTGTEVGADQMICPVPDIMDKYIGEIILPRKVPDRDGNQEAAAIHRLVCGKTYLKSALLSMPISTSYDA